MMHEANYYKIIDKNTVECTLCPRYCRLKNNKTGSCKTRFAKDGKLYTNAYNNLCSMHIDPIEKKPLYHFLPGSKSMSVATAGCVFHCLNCQNHSISQVSPDKIPSLDITPEMLIRKTKVSDCLSISYTYTDPIAYFDYTLDSAKLAHKENIKNIIISSGYINEEPLRELAKYIDAANIDLKSFNDNTYRKISEGRLEPVLNTLKVLHEFNVWIEITYLIIPTINDDIDEIIQMCKWLTENGLDKYPLHFSRFFPTYRLDHLNATPVDFMYKARDIAYDSGIKYVYLGNVQDSDVNNTYCPNCKKLLIARSGYHVGSKNISDNSCVFCQNMVDGVWN